MNAVVDGKTLSNRMAECWARAKADVRGNFSIMFAIAAPALIIIIGMGVDYFIGLSAKSRLDSAADAAALAAVNTAKAFYAANSGTMSDVTLQNEAMTAGQMQGAKVFAANVGSTQLSRTLTPSIQMSYQSLNFTAVVGWSSAVASHFGALVGINNIGIAGTSKAQAGLPKYLDFYVVTDVSGSMGIPTSTADQQLLILTNPDNALEASVYPSGCQFACHFPGYSGFAFTQKTNPLTGQPTIPLKLNTVGNAINTLLSTASNPAYKVIANQFRVGIYPFIVDAIQAAPLSSNFASVSAIANNLANYIDQGPPNQGMGSGGTHFENLWKDLSGYFQTAGDGLTSSTAQPFIILVTDGVDNNQTYVTGFNGSQVQAPNLSFCASAKAMGYTVAVLYIPYVPIFDPVHIWNDEDYAVNALIPSIPSSLESCASPSYYFQAGTAAEINSAMQQIFYQAVAASRLIQ